MKTNFLGVLFIVYLWPQQSWSKVYQRNINKNTPKWRRNWGGPASNTGDNYGGWLMRIVNSDASTICGAAYYAPILLIASANCIEPHRYSLEGASVEPTAMQENDQNIFGVIDTVYTPEDFRYLNQYMDVAVIRLRNPIKGKLTEFIQLCNVPIKTGMEMTAYAWGFDSINIVPLSSDPRNGTVTVEDPKSCDKKYGGRFRLSNTSFCVTHPKNPADCRYDSGSPLTYGNRLCGIVSYGPLCSDTTQPGVYTDINKVQAFILDIEKKIKSGFLRQIH
ncbi:hypothetical protein KR026_000141, partial [Drosophila bipectinata]